MRSPSPLILFRQRRQALLLRHCSQLVLEGYDTVLDEMKQKIEAGNPEMRHLGNRYRSLLSQLAMQGARTVEEDMNILFSEACMQEEISVNHVFVEKLNDWQAVHHVQLTEAQATEICLAQQAMRQIHQFALHRIAQAIAGTLHLAVPKPPSMDGGLFRLFEDALRTHAANEEGWLEHWIQEVRIGENDALLYVAARRIADEFLSSHRQLHHHVQGLRDVEFVANGQAMLDAFVRCSVMKTYLDTAQMVSSSSSATAIQTDFHNARAALEETIGPQRVVALEERITKTIMRELGVEQAQSRMR